jgi:glycosyltransferase involved in cell wall biosynthesis
VLPSFYEGLPLVLVEVLACGCRVVATALPGIVEELAPRLGSALNTVELPRMASVDRPSPDGLPAFLEHLQGAIKSALDAPPLREPPGGLADFTWASVFARIDRVWRNLAPATS